MVVLCNRYVCVQFGNRLRMPPGGGGGVSWLELEEIGTIGRLL
jgi:hypothetical protein